MRAVCQLVMACAMVVPLAAQQIIDRIVTVVNGRVITQNDWDEQERFEALAEGRPPEQAKHSAAALERLIDHVLLLQQMAELNFRPPAPELVQQEVQSIKKQFRPEEMNSEAAWQKTLSAYGIPQEDFNQLVTEQANVLRFIDVRFRSNTRIAQYEIETYYRETFVPQFQKESGGNAVPPLRQVQDKIQQVLTEQRVSEGLNSFVQSLRAQAVIRNPKPITDQK
jgi:hypothetical protein